MKKNAKYTVSPKTLELYRSMLPHGAQKEIAERAGISRKESVSDFLAGRTSNWRIEAAILDYIADFQANREAKLEKAGLR